MLVLTRNIGEKINIGDDVSITVLKVIGDQTHLGTNAPQEVPVHREEIYYRIKRQKAQQVDAEHSEA